MWLVSLDRPLDHRFVALRVCVAEWSEVQMKVMAEGFNRRHAAQDTVHLPVHIDTRRMR